MRVREKSPQQAHYEAEDARSSNPFLRRMEAGGKNKHGRLSERRLAKSLGARLTPASGAKRGAKSDMALDDFRLEAKSTINNSIPLQLAWLVKITHEAHHTGKRPAVAISFVTKEGKPVAYASEWVMIPRADFDELTE